MKNRSYLDPIFHIPKSSFDNLQLFILLLNRCISHFRNGCLQQVVTTECLGPGDIFGSFEKSENTIGVRKVIEMLCFCLRGFFRGEYLFLPIDGHGELLLKNIELVHNLIKQDLSGLTMAQGDDIIKPFFTFHKVDIRLTHHAPITNKDRFLDRETLLEFFYERNNGCFVRYIASKNLKKNG